MEDDHTKAKNKKDLTQRLSAAEPQPNAGIADIADIAGI